VVEKLAHGKPALAVAPVVSPALPQGGE